MGDSNAVLQTLVGIVPCDLSLLALGEASGLVGADGPGGQGYSPAAKPVELEFVLALEGVVGLTL